MTPTPLDQKLVDRIGTLKVRVSRAVEGVRSGLHRSPHRGASVVFAEHRDYRPGDDTRLLDWRAFARNDRYTIKHFEQETHLRAHLALDASPSMAYGQPDETKADYAATLLGALGMILLRQSDAVGASHFGNGLLDTLPSRSRSDHMDELLAFLAASPATTSATDLSASLLGLGERLTGRGLVIVASDLLDEHEAALAPLSMLRARGHEVWVFHVLHRDELDLPFHDAARFTDPEGDGHIELDPQRLREAYRERIDAFVDSRRAQCVAAGCRYRFAPTDHPAEQVLADALARR